MPERGKTNDRWRFVVVAAGFMARLLATGIPWASGVMFIVFLEVFNTSKADTAWVGSLITASSYAASPISGVLTNKFGCRVVLMLAGFISGTGLCLSMFANTISFLVITYGILTGAGLGLVGVPVSVAVSEYFIKHRALNLALVSSGGGMGGLIFPAYFRLLLNAYDWRGTLLITGAVAFNITVCGTFMRPANQKIDKDVKIPDVEDKSEIRREIQDISELSLHTITKPSNEGTKKQLINWSIFKNSSYFIYNISNMLYIFGYSIVSVHMAEYAHTHLPEDVTEDSSAMLLSVMGIMGLVSRLAQGAFLNYCSVDAQVVYIGCITVAGICTVLLPYMSSYASLMVYSSVFGFCHSAYGGAVAPIILLDMLGLDNLAMAYGTTTMVQSIGMLTGAPIAGALYDTSKTYNSSFYLSGTVMMIAGLLMVIPYKFIRPLADKDNSSISTSESSSPSEGCESSPSEECESEQTGEFGADKISKSLKEGTMKQV